MLRIILSTFLLLLSHLATAQPQRYFVDRAASGQNNGQSWTDAFTNLHDALALAQSGDEIWVAAGLYRPGVTDRNVRFELLSGVALYGGFAATELDISERDPGGDPTILDGDIGIEGDSTDNSYNLLYMVNPDSNTLVDGFTFRYAVANHPSAANGTPGASGAALYMMALNGEAYPYIRHCVFERNTARSDGGAVYINGKGSGSVAPVFDNCRFTANRSSNGFGGAICRYGGSWIDRPEDIKDCILEENVAYRRGGAIYFVDTPRSDTFDISGSIIRRNSYSVPAVGNGSPYEGTVFYLELPRSQGTYISIRNSKVLENVKDGASVFGCLAVFFEVGDVNFEIDSSYFNGNHGTFFCENLGTFHYDIRNSKFEDDAAVLRSGSGYEIDEKSSIIASSEFLNCKLVSLSFNSLEIIFRNLRFDRNKENEILAKDNYQPLLNTPVEIIIENSIISNSGYFNNIQNEYITTGLVIYGNLTGQYINLIVKLQNATLYKNIISNYETKSLGFKNCIVFSGNVIYKNGYNLAPNNIDTITFDHNIFNIPDTFNAANILVKTGNLWSTNPFFVAPDSNDFRLQACSPAINAGNNTGVFSATDLLGQPRIRFGTVDIGAIEAGDLEFPEPPPVQSSCENGANGTIDISGLDACLPAVYTWSHDPGSNTPLQTSLAPGLYTVTVTDTKGRSVAATIQVPDALPPQLTPVSHPVICGDTLGGSAAVVAEGSAGPYSFDWNPGTDSLLTGLAAGAYPVTVTDAQGCTAAATVSVDLQGSLNVDIQVDAISCPGAADGSLSVLPANGKAPYAWLWNDGAQGPTLAPLGPGIYQGTVTDAFGCKIQWFLPLSDPDALAFTGIVGPASGPQVADGGIALDSLGGGSAPYSVSWSNGMNGFILNGLLPGTYTAMLTDANGCTLSKSFVVPFTSGMSDINERIFDCRLFPNPSVGAIYISGTGEGEMHLELFDASGRSVFEQPFFVSKGGFSQRRFDLQLPSGAYKWRLVSDKGILGGVLIFVR